MAEYWNAADARWQMVDAQLDATWRQMIGFAGDPFAIAATEFVTAGHAWQAWRRGELDAGRCGYPRSTSTGRTGSQATFASISHR